MSKSYAQVNNHTVVNWKKELQLAIEGKKSEVDWNLVNYWNTCYVGQMSELIPRVDNVDLQPEPFDKLLKILGTEFTELVNREEFEGALCIANMLDVRCEFLLNELLTNLKESISSKEAELKELKLKLKKF